MRTITSISSSTIFPMVSNEKEQFLISRIDQGEPLCHFLCLHGFANIVGPDDFCSAGHSGKSGTEGAGQTIVGIGCTAEVIDP